MSKSTSNHSIQYGTTKIDFQIAYSPRKTLGISVTPELIVKVTAPNGASLEKIREKVEKRAKWIVKQKYFFGDFLPKNPPREYVNGETHLYLGKQYRLKLIETRRNIVKLKGKYIIVSCKNAQDTATIKFLLGDWYRQHAIRIFQWRLDQILEKNKRFKSRQPVLQIRRMVKRWGSCTSEHKLILNPEIIKAPVKCIDYVLIHELCHLEHHNHGKEFYKLQSKIMPDCKKWKLNLDRILA